MSFEDGGYTPIFDLFPLQPRRGVISVERSEPPSANPVGVTSTICDKIFTHPSQLALYCNRQCVRIRVEGLHNALSRES